MPASSSRNRSISNNGLVLHGQHPINSGVQAPPNPPPPPLQSEHSRARTNAIRGRYLSFNGSSDGASWAGSSLTFRDDGMTPDSTAVSSSTTSSTESSAKSQSLLSHSRRIRERQREQLERQFYGRSGGSSHAAASGPGAAANTIASPRPQRKSTLSLENPEELYEKMEDELEQGHEPAQTPRSISRRRSRRISLTSESPSQAKSTSMTRQFIQGLSAAEMSPKNHVSTPALVETGSGNALSHVMPTGSQPSSTVEAADSSTLEETLDHQEKILLFYKEQMDRMVDNSQRLEARLKQVQREKDAARAQVMDAIQRLAEQQVHLNSVCEENVQLKTQVKEYQEQEQRYWRRSDVRGPPETAEKRKKRRGSSGMQESESDQDDFESKEADRGDEMMELDDGGEDLPTSESSSSTLGLRSSSSSSSDSRESLGETLSDLNQSNDVMSEHSSPEPTPVIANRKSSLSAQDSSTHTTGTGTKTGLYTIAEQSLAGRYQELYDDDSGVYCVIGLEVALQPYNGTIVEESPSVQEHAQAQIDWQQRRFRRGSTTSPDTSHKLKHGSSTMMGHKTYMAMLEHLRSKPNQQSEALDQAVLMGELKARDDNERKVRLIKQRDKYATSTKSRRDELFRQKSEPASQFIVEPMYDEERVEALEHRRSAPNVMISEDDDDGMNDVGGIPLETDRNLQGSESEPRTEALPASNHGIDSMLL